ncbi:MAG: AAA family ATPase [Rhodothermales bacterium]|nr:AAA family ATPase [Rhodothermales bacterium]
MPPPFIVAITAFPGTGKTVTANYLSRALDLPVLSSSDIRGDFGWAPRGSLARESTPAEVEAALQRHSELAYGVLSSLIQERLAMGHSVLVEGTFNTQEQRESLYELQQGAPDSELIFVRCSCSRDHALSRIEHRRVLNSLGFRAGREVVDIRIYDRYRETFEDIREDKSLAGPNVSLIQYETDNQDVNRLHGCAAGSQAAAVLHLVQALAGAVGTNQSD